MDRPADVSGLEPLSPRLRAVVEALVVDIDSMIRRVVQIVKDAAPDYTLSADPHLPQELVDSVTLNAHLWYDALLSAQPVSPDKLDAVSALARRRVHQGVAMASMLRAYRVGSRGYWVTLIGAVGDDAELQHELLFKVSPYLLQHFDVVAQAMAQAYTAEQLQHARWRDRLRLELWNVISARPDDVDAFRRHAEALGVDAWAPHCALALRLGGGTGPSSKLEDVVEKLLARISRTVNIERDACMRALYRDHLVLWLPVQRGETLVDSDRRFAAQATEILANCQTVVAAGVGLPGSGSRGWRLSMDQAFRALDATGSGATKPLAHRYSEILLDDAASSSENVQRYLDAMIERLTAEPHLLETLETYLELRQHRKAVSSKLNVHPNTLDHRLERIETLLGGRFDDVSWLALVNTALRLRRHAAPSRTAPYP